MKHAIITGVTGQDGAYLTQLLLERGYRVYGTYRRTSSVNFWRLEELGVHNHPRLELVEYDLTDPGASIRLLQRAEPDEVYNLAAQSFVGVSFDQPITTAQITGIGALHLLEAIRTVNPKIRFYQASTSEMYGKIHELPQTETTFFHPRSPYGVAKLFAHWSTVNYRESYAMHTSNGILFNHESPRRGETFVTRKITRAATRIKLGLQEKLFLGNLDARRDWGYAPDYVRAMWLMLQQDTPDDYVIATHEAHSVREFISEAFGILDLDWQEFVAFDPRYQRPAEVDLLIGDYTKAKKRMGWKPSVTFKDLVRLMIEADLILARHEKAMLYSQQNKEERP
ncbi:MAG TPA: GDP-mannose 4,6-dehydratase [Verrucomicrobia bacterium]|nr:GDP-mannose 4,6-dehydratase [Verrucomicrobiota bacterium]